MTDAELTETLKRLALDLGFSMVGVAPAVAPTGLPRLDDWIDAGYAGEMEYFAQRREAYATPDRILRGAKSLLMLAIDYRTEEPTPAEPGQGRVARSAWGDLDYHDVVRPKLHRLNDKIRELRPDCEARGLIDTAPLLEREFATKAGLGWAGKNTLLLNKGHGSFFYLAAVITTAQLVADSPHATDHCGSCTACLDACPTQAFVGPHLLDATRCISYLTIESKQLPPAELRDGIGEWLFGCDVCQDVCPWNRHAKPAVEHRFRPGAEMDPVELAPLFDLDEVAFRARFRKHGLWRAKRQGVLRNAAMVLGATRALVAEPALAKGLADEHPLVRGAAAWALGRLATATAQQTLRARLEVEQDESVRKEIESALRVDEA